jgi:PadR family transcriptional regulator PadR
MDTSPPPLSDKFAPIRKGLLEFAVLRVIASEKLYVAQMLQRLASTEFATQEGTLYPLLSRLRRDGLVDYEWRESEAGPPRKYYRLTDSGQRALAELQGYWQHLTETLNRIGN